VSVVQLERGNSEAEFEVDAHGDVSEHPEEAQAEQQAQEAAVATVVAMGWTPEEATSLVCALWNLGILIYGPEWAADPRETLGWNITVAQLLDIYVPKGTGGMVQLGAGILMIGNGLMMMAARRTDIIRRGPRPLWLKASESQRAPGPSPQAPSAAPATRAANNGGRYEMPTELVPPSNGDALNGLGI